MAKTTNVVHHNGQTYTRTGRRYSHLVIVTSSGARPVIHWASTLELAERNASQIAGRRDRARKGTLRGGWGVEWHAGITDIDVVPVEHESE
ncbi:Uncharacterised protein [Mycobacteroides abscessus subsp. abscessus]|uniref:Uncharacterized protein n=1 Tax=Mycobacteroides abscessus subsp. abscessus TaxID=1185650 RepID=A0AB38D0Y2_9MYCO|nr:hypothetical protein [Mycobacteroides abscessus]SHX05055.1 Uncharacterised protein [Mycobacteroides abscessus subsp. abscessus]SIA13853.1 Uncharacterised protein [Mycobacteroides abscessus subsp. abscessus]SIB12981.1 Uncharacterised protein [Mycobacteroides abscessus subsp. abscessus]SIB15998.1 Uncharacterised protein [Mycobacteroides abscessus subsp. abscessus]SIB19950.1 Uncharacterised protein [Mycobacteroides abscessus subsp. abscessus]